ncbi:hypothetical protein WJX74_000535 [Apatococcus lobatus]|uniref:Glutathione peroxidase n=1 Tax=Apatococcus lobatus TaxID=904363 RepID=A0AAW1QIF2_9CHLO
MRPRSGPLLPMQAGRGPKTKPKQESKLLTAVMVIFLLSVLSYGAYLTQRLASPPDIWIDPGVDATDPSKEQARRLAEKAKVGPIIVNEEPCDGDDCVASNQPGALAGKGQRKAGLEASGGSQPNTPRPEGLYTMAALDITNRNRPLTEFSGFVTLVTNVASQCGYTESNYAGLQKLYDKFHSSGFEVLAFPCNQFNNQEPGSPDSIQAFIKEKNITFPIFAKAEEKPAVSHRVLSPAARSSSAGRGFGAPDTRQTGFANPSPLPPPPDLGTKDPRAIWNPTSLAFLGDSVWELYVRRHFLNPPTRVTTYCENVVSMVRAESQETLLETLLAGPLLSPSEHDIVRWGRNAQTTTPTRFSKSSVHKNTYRNATALECLVGYLHLTDPVRLHQLMLHLELGFKDASGNQS